MAESRESPVVGARKRQQVAVGHTRVAGLTETIALEHPQTGVTCNAICPGWLKNPLVEVQIRNLMDREGLGYEQAASGLMRGREPSQRFTTADQVASAVLLRASEAADKITGINLGMVGGWTAQ